MAKPLSTILIYFPTELGAAAKAVAAPLRHRRNHVFLRDIFAYREAGCPAERADRVVVVREGADWTKRHGELLAKLKAGSAVERLYFVTPGDQPWEPTEEEARAMNPLNKLRHDAALYGIEVKPEYDELALSVLIADAKQRQEEADAAELKKQEAITAEADRLAAERAASASAATEGAGTGAAPSGEAPADAAKSDGGSEAPAETGNPGPDAGEKGPPAAAEQPQGAAAGEGGSEAPPAAGAAQGGAQEEKADPLAGINLDDAAALRAFAATNNIPVSPNPRTGAEKLLAGIRSALEARNAP